LTGFAQRRFASYLDRTAASRSGAAAKFARWLPWARHTLLAIVDQGLVSGSNFVMGVLLARWLLAGEFGAYALAFSVFLLVAGFHQNLLLSPLSVLGASMYGARTRDYLGAVLWIQAAFGAVAAVGLLLAAWVAARLHQGDLASALAGLAIASPCVLLFWLARGAHYLELSPGPAAKSASLYAISMLAGLAVMHRYQSLSPFSVFVLTGFGSLAVSYSLLRRLRPIIRASQRSVTVRSVWREHWNYGRWELGTGIVYWVGENISMVFTGAVLGLSEVGAFKALTSLSLPAIHIVVAVGRLVQPHLSRLPASGGTDSLGRSVRTIALLLLGGSLVNLAIMTLFHGPIFRLLYGGKFMEYAHLVPLVALGLVFYAGYQAYCGGSRALQSPASLLGAYSVSMAVSVVFGIPAVRWFGLTGILVNGAVSGFALFAMGAFLFHRKLRSAARRPAPAGGDSMEFDAVPVLSSVKE
jgi:O-antigen/teichoic acid export membrane protein